MSRTFRHLVALGLLAAAPASFASVMMDLTGVGNGTNYGGVYDSPYDISINGLASMLLSCDDFATEINIGSTWTAMTENAASVDGSVKFSTPYSPYTLQQTYSAAAWIATQLVTPAIMGNTNPQIDYSLALWELFDPTLSGPINFTGSLNGPDYTGPGTGVPNVLSLAFAAVSGGYTGSNVTVYTPNPLDSGQEFLQVNPVPLPGALPLLFSGMAGLGTLICRRRAALT
jgi:hypothetical protein